MREDHPHQRRLAKNRHKHERRKARRTEGATALIVCEGKCTEPYYLRALLALLGISTASAVIVPGQTNADSVAVVTRAKTRFAQTPEFDKVFVVIDGDQANLDSALALCATPVQRENQREGRPEICIQPIISTPCIEFWLLLHFAYTDQPFSNCEDVKQALQVHLPNYRKADPKIFQNVGGETGLGLAMEHVERLITAHTVGGKARPSTNLPILVEALRAMRTPSGSTLPPSANL